jgi:hypothetical protein
MYDKEDITITRMLNLETGRQLSNMEKNMDECDKKRMTVKS